jgi:DNA-binding MarR family transcriptional regulator
MELTSRQIEFVEKLLDLYDEIEESIHYSQVADRLGVSRSTAYEMLRLLERKGFARSHYFLDESGGPGRSTVLFSPTERAHTMFSRLREQVGAATNWDNARNAIIETVARGGGPDQGSLSEILIALGRDERALSESTRVVTAALLVCNEHAQKTPGFWELVEAALQSESGLVLLPGIALASIEGGAARRRMLQRWQSFQQDFISLAPEQQEDLLRLARELGTRMRVAASERRAPGESEGYASP